jgi:hypothetical protein
MTLFYPDIAWPYQKGINLKAEYAVAIKATEGNYYTSPSYGAWLAQANADTCFPFAYHFLVEGSVSAQAQYCFNAVGITPVMLDFESIPSDGSNPSAADALGFISDFRSLGGICHLLYLPRWYWQQLGSPSLSAFAGDDMQLVSSDYTSYTDDASGAGWQPYGGMQPVVWQYSDATESGGVVCDFNAYRGTLADLESIVRTGSVPVPGKLGKVVGLHLIASTPTTVTLGWDAVPGATGYEVGYGYPSVLEFSAWAGSPRIVIGFVAADADHDYHFAVTAVNAEGHGPTSDVLVVPKI